MTEDVTNMIQTKILGSIFQAFQPGPYLPSQFYLSLITITFPSTQNDRALILLHDCPPSWLSHCIDLVDTPCDSLCLNTGPLISPTLNPVHFSRFYPFFLNQSSFSNGKNYVFFWTLMIILYLSLIIFIILALNFSYLYVSYLLSVSQRKDLRFVHPNIPFTQ